jgi:heme exporter protein D
MHLILRQAQDRLLGILRTSKAVSYALSFFWLDGFAVPALIVELVVEPVETLSRHSAMLCDSLRAQARWAEMTE